MNESLHRGLRESEACFDTRKALASAVGMPRTTLVGWLDAEPGTKTYVPEPEDEKRLSRLINSVFAEGHKTGYEAGQQDHPDLPENEERVHDGEVYKTAKNVADPVQTPEEAAEHFGIDTDRYYADKIECGKHTVPVKPSEAKTMMVQGKERLVREETIVEVECYRLSVTWRPHIKRQMAASFVEGLMEDRERPTPPTLPAAPNGGIVRTISIPDLHLGNLIWDPQGQSMQWNLQTGKEQWKEAFAYLLRGAEDDGVTDVVIDIGNDAAHANGVRGQSANGTPYNQVAPAYHTSEAMASMYRWGIEEAVSRGLRVHAVTVGGNHDWDPAQWMGRALDMTYEAWENVIVHRSPEPWQFLQFGGCLLGYTHGKNPEGRQLKAKDLYALAAEQEGWHQANYVEVRTGHTHHRELDALGGYAEHKGVLIRTSPSLCPADAFHKRNLYHQALRAAERYDLHPEYGLVEHTPYLPDLLNKN